MIAKAALFYSYKAVIVVANNEKSINNQANTDAVRIGKAANKYIMALKQKMMEKTQATDNQGL